MLKKMKYVVIGDMYDEGTKSDTIFVFPMFATHKNIAHALLRNQGSRIEVIGAGFCYPPDELNPMPTCFGESVSLNIKSRPEDTDLLVQLMVE